jgi:hypothetical protein
MKRTVSFFVALAFFPGAAGAFAEGASAHSEVRFKWA